MLAAGPRWPTRQLFAALRRRTSVAGNAGTTAGLPACSKPASRPSPPTGCSAFRFASEVAQEVSAISNNYLTSDTSFCNVGAPGLCRMHGLPGRGYTVILKRLGDAGSAGPCRWHYIFWNYDADGAIGAFTLSGDTTLLGGHCLR